MTPDNNETGGSRDSTEKAGEAARDLRDDAIEEAQSLKDRAASEAARHAYNAKGTVADEISDMGDALRRAADELRDGSPQERTFGQVASVMADFSDTVRDKDMGEIVEDVSALARRNPMAFLGGAAMLGFAGVRMTKASQRNQHKAADMANMWGSDEDDDALEAELFGRSTGSGGGTDTTGGSVDRSGIPGPATTPAPSTGPALDTDAPSRVASSTQPKRNF